MDKQLFHKDVILREPPRLKLSKSGIRGDCARFRAMCKHEKKTYVFSLWQEQAHYWTRPDTTLRKGDLIEIAGQWKLHPAGSWTKCDGTPGFEYYEGKIRDCVLHSRGNVIDERKEGDK